MRLKSMQNSLLPLRPLRPLDVEEADKATRAAESRAERDALVVARTH